MGCGINKCSPIAVDNCENVAKPQRLHLFDLSDDILRYILRFLPKGQILWNVGLASTRLQLVSLSILSEVELNWQKANKQNSDHVIRTVVVKEEVNKLKQIYCSKEIIKTIKHIVICCNGKDAENEYCISNNEGTRQCILNEIKCSSNQHESQFSWFKRKHTHEPNNHRRKSSQPNCEQNNSNSFHSQDSNWEDKVPELTLILHGRLSDLDRYGKLRAEVDIYKMFHNLLSIHFVSCNIYHIGMNSIIDHSKETMRGLSIHESPELSEASIYRLIKSAIHLRSLNLNGCDHVLDYASLKTILGNCNYLENLNLHNCPILDDEGLELIADQCPFLRSLDIGHCIQITDSGIEALSVTCSRIINLDLAFCIKITVRGMTSVAKNLKNLKHLNITGCDNISESTFKHLKDYNANVVCIAIESSWNTDRNNISSSDFQ